MSHDEASPKHGADLNIPLIITIGLVTSIIVLAIVVPGLQAVLTVIEDQYAQTAVVEQASHDLRSHQLEQAETIQTYRYIDRENDIVAIPVDRAMELYLQRQAGGDGVESN